MSVTDDLNAVIENEMAALSKEQFIRPGCAFDIYEKYYSKLLAQTEKDREPLTAAGFKYEERMPKYIAYQEKLAVEHGQRVNAESDERALLLRGVLRAVTNEYSSTSPGHRDRILDRRPRTKPTSPVSRASLSVELLPRFNQRIEKQFS